MRAGIEVRARAQQRQIRLGLGVLAEDDGVLDRHHGELPNGLGQEPIQLVDTSPMRAPDRRHLNNLPLDELNPFVLTQDAGLAHAMKIGDAEAAVLQGSLIAGGHASLSHAGLRVGQGLSPAAGVKRRRCHPASIAENRAPFSRASVNRVPTAFAALFRGCLRTNVLILRNKK
jgi:hypothetical protein